MSLFLLSLFLFSSFYRQESLQSSAFVDKNYSPYRRTFPYARFALSVRRKDVPPPPLPLLVRIRPSFLMPPSSPYFCKGAFPPQSPTAKANASLPLFMSVARYTFSFPSSDYSPSSFRNSSFASRSVFDLNVRLPFLVSPFPARKKPSLIYTERFLFSFRVIFPPRALPFYHQPTLFFPLAG